ncbi:MAG: hypothetical protein HYY25_01265 [Candidatus Wallbacteria bacterium]|nr:hypothetical protein [Candidatus Wallbacteria bacterium]
MTTTIRILPIVVLALAAAAPAFGQLLGLGAGADASSRVQALAAPGAQLGGGFSGNGALSSGGAAAQWGADVGAAVRGGPSEHAFGVRGGLESGFGASVARGAPWSGGVSGDVSGGVAARGMAGASASAGESLDARLEGMGAMGARLRQMREEDPRGFQAFLDAHQGLRYRLEGIRPGERTGWIRSRTAEADANARLETLWRERADLTASGASAESVAAVDSEIAVARAAASPPGQRRLGARLSADGEADAGARIRGVSAGARAHGQGRARGRVRF